MGAGRKTETFTLAPDSLNTYGNCCVRNLEKKDLCGAIFGFKFSTINECYGLPAPHLAYIKNIDPGLIFEGQLNIDLKAWSPNGTEPSPYPAQVKMLLPGDPFVEENFSLVIADNDKDEKIFWFELDRDQTSKLLRRSFSPSPSVRTYKYAASPSRKAIPASSLVEIGDATRVDKWSSTHEVPSQASKGVENPWSSAASRALSSRQDTTKGTSPAALNMIGSSKDVSADDAQSEIDWDAASNFQAHLEGLNKILEDPGDSFNSCVTMCVRNLHKGCLCGAISGSTFCTKKLSGLPAAHVGYIKNIDPKAWSPNGTDPIPYPAQVKMQVRVRCEPLVDEKFIPVIADNYKDEKMFELAHKELGMSVTDQLPSVKASVPPQDPCSKKRKWLEVGSSEPNNAKKRKKQINLKLHRRRLLSEYEREDWSLLVNAGRCISVSPGDENIICINNVRFNDEDRPDNHLLYDDLRAPECEVYVGINSTQIEFLMGNLNTLTRPQLHFPVPILFSEAFTLAHSAYSTLSFTGYRYGRHPQLQPRESDKGWPFDDHITTKIMSNISSSADIARSEIACKRFGRVGHDPSVYENVNLTKHAASQELSALMCMRRAAGKIRSFEIGIPGRDGANYLYTRRVLEPFQYLGGLLTKISLIGLTQLSTTVDLQPVFARCPLLKEFQLHNVPVPYTDPMPVDMVLQSVSEHCRMLEVLVYDNRYGLRVAHMTIGEGSLNGFVGNCTKVKNLSLCGVHLGDNQMLVILQELKRLEKLDLSQSIGFRGSFLEQGGDVEDIRLRDLRLELCRDLTEPCLEQFFLRLRGVGYPNMRHLVVKCGVLYGAAIREGFQERTLVEDLVEERRDIEIETGFELLNGMTQEDLDRPDDFFAAFDDGQEGDQEKDQGGGVLGGEVEAVEEEDDQEEVEAMEEEENENEDEEPELELELVMSSEEEDDSEDDSEDDDIDIVEAIDRVSRMRNIYWWKEDDTDTALQLS